MAFDLAILLLEERNQLRMAGVPNRQALPVVSGRERDIFGQAKVASENAIDEALVRAVDFVRQFHDFMDAHRIRNAIHFVQEEDSQAKENLGLALHPLHAVLRELRNLVIEGIGTAKNFFDNITNEAGRTMSFILQGFVNNNVRVSILRIDSAEGIIAHSEVLIHYRLWLPRMRRMRRREATAVASAAT